MVDSTIKPGDVAIDLQDGAKLQVVARAADSVAAFRAEEGMDLAEYKSHPLFDVTDDEPVWTCVYLPGDVSTSFNGTYDFPDSRLARVPVEEANQQLERVQRDLVVEVLATLLENATEAGDKEVMQPEDEILRSKDLAEVVELCWPDEHAGVFDDALELAEARVAAEEGDD